MNALARPLPATPRSAALVALLPRAMARDLLGFEALPLPSPVAPATLPAFGPEAALSVADRVWPAGTRSGPHCHPAADEILIVLSGLVEVRIEGRATRHGPGGSAVIARGLLHEVTALTEARLFGVLTHRPLGEPAA